MDNNLVNIIKMKKTILIVLISALCFSAWAQEEEHNKRCVSNEIAIGYGFHPVSGDEFLFSTGPFGHDIDKVGAFYGAYTHFFNQHFGVGGTYCYDPRKIQYWYQGLPTNGVETQVCLLNESCHSLMGHVKINTVSKKCFTHYVKLDTGLCFWGYQLTEYHPELFTVECPDKHCCFAWQVATGIEVGYGPVAGFLQCGIGMEGNYSLGIRYKFKNSEK